MKKSRLAALVLLAACSGPAGTDPTNPPGTPDGDPINGPGTPSSPVPSSAGPYKAVTHVDLSVELILPAQAELVVTTLRTFSTNPGQALIELPGNAGVPAIGALLDVVPGALKGKLEGYVNGYIDPLEVHGVKVTDAAGSIAALAETALSQADLDSDLTITGTDAAQQFTAIDLTPAGLNARIPLDIPTDLVSATTTATYGEGATLTLGDQHFGVEYGEYAWRAVNQATAELFGGDIRTTLGRAVNCPNLGQHVANECVLGVCIGHASLVTNACEAGLDFVVDQMHAKFDAIDIDVVHFASGRATLVDDDGDGVADRLATGTWDAELNVGLGLRHVPASFDATR